MKHSNESKSVKVKVSTIRIKLPTGQEFTPSPGTVPTSYTPPKDSLKRMIKAANEVSDAGIFGSEEYGREYRPTPR